MVVSRMDTGRRPAGLVGQGVQDGEHENGRGIKRATNPSPDHPCSVWKTQKTSDTSGIVDEMGGEAQ